MHKPHRFGLPILALLAASCAGNAPPGAAGGEAAPADAVRAPVEVERFAHDNPGFPFSKAVRVDGLVYLSGQIGMDYASGKVVEGFEAQARQTMDNVKADLESIGLGMDDVVKCTLMIVDMSRWSEFNEIYRGYFSPDRLPARSALGASALALGAEMEVECIAADSRGQGAHGI